MIIVCPKMYFVLQPKVVLFDAYTNKKYWNRHIFYCCVLIFYLSIGTTDEASVHTCYPVNRLLSAKDNSLSELVFVDNLREI